MDHKNKIEYQDRFEPTWEGWKIHIFEQIIWLIKWTALILIFWFIVPIIINAYVATTAKEICQYLK